jgi:prepilin-type N-terminal cleavage/methylation domain-containing protein
MRTKSTEQNHGFTIIEVMIVLAIAGLILAVVLLAVPALQRSQRNNARSSDATHWAGLVSDYVSNHGGTLPGIGAFASTDTFSQLTAATVVNQGTTGASTTAAIIDTNVTCNNTTNALTAQTGSFAIVWQAEAASGNTTVCIPG